MGSGKISPWNAVANQTWGAGAFSRKIYHGMFGMDFKRCGLPATEADVDARCSNLQYEKREKRCQKITLAITGACRRIPGMSFSLTLFPSAAPADAVLPWACMPEPVGLPW